MTLLIWKVIRDQPGITADQIYTRIENQIPQGWATRRYLAHLEAKEKDKKRTKIGTHLGRPDLPQRARRYVLTEQLAKMRREDNRRGRSIVRDGDKPADGYRTVRFVQYYGKDPDDVRPDGGASAGHWVNGAAALKDAKALHARISDQRRRTLTASEFDTVGRLIESYEAFLHWFASR